MPSRPVHAVVGEHEDDHRVPLSLHGSASAAEGAAADYRSRERAPTAPYETIAGDPSEYLYERFDAYTVETWELEDGPAVDSEPRREASGSSSAASDGDSLRRPPAVLAGLVGLGALFMLGSSVSVLSLTLSEVGILSILLSGLVFGAYAVAFLATVGVRSARRSLSASR